MDSEIILENMRKRRSVRVFEDREVPNEAIQQILEAARVTQSANNKQPWRFIVIKNKSILTHLAAMANYGKFISDAPLGIAIVADTKLCQNGISKTLACVLIRFV